MAGAAVQEPGPPSTSTTARSPTVRKADDSMGAVVRKGTQSTAGTSQNATNWPWPSVTSLTAPGSHAP